jgi:glycine/D-amino acid oxidase-like deaminating enzyme
VTGKRGGASANAIAERTTSLWMNVEVAPGARPLRSDVEVDVIVVGSGIAGLSTAYELIRRGQKVIVLDRGTVAGGMSSRTTAHLVPICDDSFDSFIKLRGLEAAKLFYKSQAAAVDRIEAIQTEERIFCNFRRVKRLSLSCVARGSRGSRRGAESGSGDWRSD